MLQETKLLQSIDRLRGEADMVKWEQRVAEALALMANPKAWPLSNGALLEVHTPATTKYTHTPPLERLNLCTCLMLIQSMSIGVVCRLVSMP